MLKYMMMMRNEVIRVAVNCEPHWGKLEKPNSFRTLKLNVRPSVAEQQNPALLMLPCTRPSVPWRMYNQFTVFEAVEKGGNYRSEALVASFLILNLTDFLKGHVKTYINQFVIFFYLLKFLKLSLFLEDMALFLSNVLIGLEIYLTTLPAKVA